MRVLPASPRARRRLARLGVIPVAAAVVTGVILLLPSNPSQPPQSAAPASGNSAPSQPSQQVAEKPIRLTAADRAAIDRTFDAFVPAVVERRNLAAGFDTVTRAMREGQTRAQWAHSNPPVMLYHARGTRFHDWDVKYAYPHEASIELMLQPRAAHTVAITFDVDVRQVGRRWLVDSIAPAALFSPGRVVAAKDFGAQPARDATGNDSKLSGTWIAAPIAFFCLIPILLIGLWVRAWVRNERARRAYERRIA
jgi:hypothetical protein